jgi:hypothetical protein
MTEIERLGIETDTHQSRTNVFWSQDPNVLLTDPLYFFPSRDLSLEQQLNAVSRIIIILGVGGYLYSRNTRNLLIASVLLFSIYVFYIFKGKDKKKVSFYEPFESPGSKVCEKNVKFQPPSAKNPMGNVTQEDIEEATLVEKLPAVPSAENGDSINRATQEAITGLNPSHRGIVNKLHSTLGDQLVFESSMRNFYSMPSTTIPNDRKGFTDFCYGLDSGTTKDLVDANSVHSISYASIPNKFRHARELPM